MGDKLEKTKIKVEQIKKYALKQIEGRLRADLMVGLSFTFLFLMVFGGALKVSAVTSNLAQNIIAGTLSVVMNNTDIGFTDVTFNLAAQNSEVNLSNSLRVTDARGNSAGWNVSAVANNLQSGTDQINSEQLVWLLNNYKVHTITNGGTDNNGIANGAGNGVGLKNAQRILIASSGNGTGIFQMNNTTLRLTIPAAQAAGTYTAVLTVTIA